MATNRSLVFAVLAVASLVPAASLATPISVTVRNHAIQAKAVTRNGQVLLPLRTTFEALNSSVSYDPQSGWISARNILHVVHIRINSRSAIVDGRTSTMPSAPQLIDHRVYVPVVFAAAAMGAGIRYDPHSNVLAINAGSVSHDSAATRAYSEPQDLNPAPNSTVQTGYPVVSATLHDAVAPTGAVALSMDGNDVTANARVDGNHIAYIANAVAPGRHTISLMGTTMNGRRFSTQWSFVSTGVFFPPGVVNNGITLIGPPSASGFGSSGLFLTGDPLSPLGQHISQPVFTPVFVPRIPQ